MSECLTSERYVKVNWRSFQIPLHFLNKLFKNTYEDFDGLGADSNELKIIFKTCVDETLKNQVISLYNSINENSFTNELDIESGLNLGDEAQIFGQNLLSYFRGENIKMGVVQANKSGTILSLITEKIDVNSDGFPISLKDALDTGTLYEAIKILDHYINKCEVGDYDSLEPFVTQERIEDLKQKILDYLD